MIPIIKVKLSEETIKSVLETLNSGIIAEGSKTKQLETEFAEYVGVKHAITVPNGTIALQIAIKCLGIKNGEIITTPFTFIASSNSILYNDLKPVFADINQGTYNLDPQKALERITDKTKAIIPVHLFGQPCEMKAFKEICEDHNLYLIEDAAQSHGAEYENKKTGGIGDVGCFSMYATKNMAMGEGGMITTNSDSLAEKIRLYRNHGQTEKYKHATLGYNYRTCDVLSAIGLQQLHELENANSKRIINAERMNKELKTVKIPYNNHNTKHVYHQYVIRTDRRDELQKYLTEKGIGTAIHYPIPVHKQLVYRQLGYNFKLPNAENASEQVLSLPVHQHLSEQDVDYVIKTVNEFGK